MQITPEMIWDAFGGVRRYEAKQIPYPVIELAEGFPYQYRHKLDALAEYLVATDSAYPLPFRGEYIAYLFLFHQWLRTSFQEAPRFVPGEGWYNLRPKPFIHMLIAIPEKARRMWEGWLSQAVHQEPPQIQSVFPFIPPAQEHEYPRVKRQLNLLTTYAAKNENPPWVILEKYDITGNIKDPFGPPSLQWHPWVQAMYSTKAEALQEILPKICLKHDSLSAFWELLGYATNRKQWLKQTLSVLNPDRHAFCIKQLKKLGRKL
jgi:hypothetical protein